MGHNLFEKIISTHLVKGEMAAGKEIGIRIDQTLTQESLGAMAYLQFEALKIPKVKTKLSVAYCDHLLSQYGPANADVHRYHETVTDKYGIVFSKPGNGICHQVHLERFSCPGQTLIGGDSHTVTSGAAGMVAIGVGGLDVALAMGGSPFFMTYPKVKKVVLRGKLKTWVTAKDVILEVLKKLTTKGNVGTVLEYGGDGIAHLTVPERSTIANMGAETGVTTSIFPSDEMTRKFFIAQDREEQWQELLPDADAKYDEVIEIDLAAIEPNVALPHSPDKVVTVKEAGEVVVDQVLIGSCTNSSYLDLMMVAEMLKGRKVHPHVSFGVVPGSRQVMSMIAKNGALSYILESGARILETGCNFCVGQGQSPQTAGVSVRTNNRNFVGRSGTQDGKVYLTSPLVAVATALTGKLTDPRELGIEYPEIHLPEKYAIDDSLILFPTGKKEIYRSEIIGTPPYNTEMPTELKSEVAIKVGNMINTDDIIPGGQAMNYRANVPKSCEFIFQFVDSKFPKNCKDIVAKGKTPVIVGGESYGQGSSREHAAVCPMYMGVRTLIAISIERIHKANLINFGILPLKFADAADYSKIEQGDELVIDDIYKSIYLDKITVRNITKGTSFTTVNETTQRQRDIILKGGLLNYTIAQ
ncbi:aconitate hydratase [Sporomusaceae bacterium BoRhaA]|uniref:aconitate hydratase n=1 Tax=Pelorhabdus rhamnosifermentans TaxID=2772457 RepID=UPI001C060E41|nr:aconitate hydratase [Pelorhabdus rhamnosifermentans]MBU2699637.1 aconitate hydratase [Pelorhabdus rhamnosifermentans]